MIIANMDPQESQKTTLTVPQMETLTGISMATTLGTPRATTPGTPRATTPGTLKIPKTPRYSTPRDIDLLSPGIDSSSSMSNVSLLRSSKSVTLERLTKKTKVLPVIRKVHKADKEVPVLKSSSAPFKNHTLSNISEKFLNQINGLKNMPQNHQVYLKKNQMILQTRVVEHFLINLTTKIRLLLRKPKHHLMR